MFGVKEYSGDILKANAKYVYIIVIQVGGQNGRQSVFFCLYLGLYDS